MSKPVYQPLPLKYRPRIWNDIVGQGHAVEVLRASVLNDKVYHAYIFSGVSGSGKTTAARIMAMTLNCGALQENAQPCLICDSCKAALAGKHPDILEIDAASQGRVEHVRALREKAAYSPQFARRVFILDEAHSMSREAYEALLKLLEEPPSHVVFILATTNAEKIPATIKGRSIRLDLRRLSEADLSARMEQIARAEGIILEPSSTRTIGLYADGSLRDAITLLDQLHVARPDEPITTNVVAEVLGLASPAELSALMSAVLHADAKLLEKVVGSIIRRTTFFGLLVKNIIDWYRDVLRVRCKAEELVKRSETDTKLVAEFARTHTAMDIEKALGVCWEMAERIKPNSAHPTTFFLTGLYRLMLLPSGEVEGRKRDPEFTADRVPIEEEDATKVTFSKKNGEPETITDLEKELEKMS